jgi:hypothetical protein
VVLATFGRKSAVYFACFKVLIQRRYLSYQYRDTIYSAHIQRNVEQPRGCIS